MAETLCPNCGYSPIPRGAEACPKCEEPFSYLQMHKRAQRRFVDRRDYEDNEVTVYGRNLTGAVSAHPGPAAAVLFAGAGAWFLRVGVFAGAGEPVWGYGLVLLDLLLGLLLLLNVGPARLLTMLGMVLQMGVTGWLGRADLTAPVNLALLAHALVAVGMVAGEPGPMRRNVGLGLGVAALLAGVGLMALPSGARGPGVGSGAQLLVSPEHGFQLELPGGWQVLGQEQLASHLVLPEPTQAGSGMAFGNAELGRYGMLWVDTLGERTLSGGCRELMRALGGGSGRAMSRPAPSSLGRRAVVFELRTASGALGALGCGEREDGRLVGLAVVATTAGREGGEAAFAVVGAGLVLQ